MSELRLNEPRQNLQTQLRLHGRNLRAAGEILCLFSIVLHVKQEIRLAVRIESDFPLPIEQHDFAFYFRDGTFAVR